MAGICLIRLKRIRPWFLPAFAGISSENAAHRIAVEWDEAGDTKEGVFVPRRDTSSRLNTLLGGRLFPGIYNHADFQVQERNGTFRVEKVFSGTEQLVGTLRMQASGCQTQLNGRGEIVKNCSPDTFIIRSAAMTFVDHDEVEEIRRIIAKPRRWFTVVRGTAHGSCQFRWPVSAECVSSRLRWIPGLARWRFPDCSVPESIRRRWGRRYSEL